MRVPFSLSDIEDKKVKLYADISYAQGGIDYKKLKADGIQGVIIRVGYTGYGTTKPQNIDAWFERHYAGVAAEGLPIGIYFYSCAVSIAEARREAENTIKFLGGRALQLPIYWDTEDNHDTTKQGNHAMSQAKLSKEALTAVAIAYFARLRELTDHPIGIYSYTTWLKVNLDMSLIRHMYPDMSVWVAHFGVFKPAYEDYMDMWQYTSSAYISALPTKDSKIDLNIVHLENDLLRKPKAHVQKFHFIFLQNLVTVSIEKLQTML